MNLNGEANTASPKGRKGDTSTTHLLVKECELVKKQTSEGSELAGVKKAG